MQVTFTRTGDRRYGLRVEAPGREARTMNPAPGFDPDIPHDLVHYMVEAELRLTGGVFGRFAAGGGGLSTSSEIGEDPRERRRQQRKQRKRETRLRNEDHAGQADMALSERYAGICDVAWKSRHGRVHGPPVRTVLGRLSGEESARVERVVARLDRVAPLWSELPIGGSLTFVWPDPEPARG